MKQSIILYWTKFLKNKLPMRKSSQQCTSARTHPMKYWIRYRSSSLLIQTFFLNSRLNNLQGWACHLFSRCYNSSKDMQPRISRNFLATSQDIGQRESPRRKVQLLTKLYKSSEWRRQRQKSSVLDIWAHTVAEIMLTHFLRYQSLLAKIMMGVINMTCFRHLQLQT
jgi:hypothetical protein